MAVSIYAYSHSFAKHKTIQFLITLSDLSATVLTLVSLATMRGRRSDCRQRKEYHMPAGGPELFAKSNPWIGVLPVPRVRGPGMTDSSADRILAHNYSSS